MDVYSALIKTVLQSDWEMHYNGIKMSFWKTVEAIRNTKTCMKTIKKAVFYYCSVCHYTRVLVAVALQMISMMIHDPFICLML